MKREDINVLVACEESQRVCTAFRALGFNAYSNDVIACGGGHPEWHILDNALSVIGGGTMKLQNGNWITIPHWDMIIAHPPCTYLSNVSVRHHSLAMTPENRIEGRTIERINAMRFFMEMIRANSNHIAVENPVGIMNTAFRKPDEIIEPYQFAAGTDDADNYVTKRTCLWLKNLPPLQKNTLPRPDNAAMFGRLKSGKPKNFEENHAKLQDWASFQSWADDATARSKTFPGIAKAMAEQWGKYLMECME